VFFPVAQFWHVLLLEQPTEPAAQKSDIFYNWNGTEPVGTPEQDGDGRDAVISQDLDAVSRCIYLGVYIYIYIYIYIGVYSISTCIYIDVYVRHLCLSYPDASVTPLLPCHYPTVRGCYRLYISSSYLGLSFCCCCVVMLCACESGAHVHSCMWHGC